MPLVIVDALRARNRRVHDHAHLPRQVALRLMRRLPGSVELDDLLGAGRLGLVIAADRFDTKRGVPFDAFARLRIHGAMLDHLRSEDPLTRGQRAAEKRRIAADPGATQPCLRLVTLDEADEHALAHGAPGPQAACESAQESVRLRAAIENLPQRERTVISLYYTQEMTLRKIGALLLVSESRVCQILRATIARLRHVLDVD